MSNMLNMQTPVTEYRSGFRFFSLKIRSGHKEPMPLLARGRALPQVATCAGDLAGNGDRRSQAGRVFLQLSN